MAVLALTSARGAPGVTTTALALTLLWPRPVLLVEADVAGGSAVLAGYLRGAVSPHARSLLGLAAAHRRGRLREDLWGNAVPLDEAGERHLLPAIADPVQAVHLSAVWSPLAALLSTLHDDGVDVIVDAGRLGAAHGPDPLLRAADLVLVLTRSQLPVVAATCAAAAGLRQRLQDPPDRSRAALLVVGDGRPYTARQIARTAGLPVAATIAWDPRGADVLSLGAPRPRGWEVGTYLRSARSAIDALTDALTGRIPGPRRKREPEASDPVEATAAPGATSTRDGNAP